MAQTDRLIDLTDFTKGFYSSMDTTKSPFGSFRTMLNAQITDRGGIAPRPGTRLIGTKNTSDKKLTGLYTYKRSFEENEILIKNYDDEMEAFSKNHVSAGWFRVKDGFTEGEEFGYVHNLVNTANENYLVGSNRFEPYFRWSGYITQLNGALVGAETTITVDSTLLADIYESKTASGHSATHFDISPAAWAANQWIGFYVHVLAGPMAGQIRRITATTTSRITFDTLGGGGAGNVAFEIRRLAFPTTGSVIYNGTNIAYTGIPTSTTLTVASAHAAPDNTILTIVPDNYPENPRGNRLTNYLGRTVVGNVRSALARDSGGTLQGFASGGSYFVSKVNNPFDFTFSSTRVAGEGDIQATPYGGGNITDVVAQEDTAYIFKRDYIEAVSYTQDVNDLAKRDPLKAGVGSVGKTTRSSDDVYFFTESKQLTTIGRVKTKDIRPQTMDVGNKIKRWLDRADVSTVGRGIEISGKIYFPLKSSSTATANDVVLVYNENTSSFEGIWDIGAFGMAEFDGNYYYGESNGANVYQMFTDTFSDVEADQEYGYSFDAKTHFFNLTSSKGYLQSIYGMVVEGYIKGGSEVTYTAYKDFSDTPFVTFTLSLDDNNVLDGDSTNIYLGDVALGLNNLSVDLSDIDADGRRHFKATVYFPWQYGSYFSVGIGSSGVGQNHETSSFSLMINEEMSTNQNRIKSI